MQDSKVGNPQRQFPVTSFTVGEQDKVTRAVHRLEGPFSFLNVQFEHVILVVSPVTRSLPDAHVVHIRRLHLLISALPVLRTQKFLQSVENLSAVREKERTPRGHFVKEEEFLVFSNPQVVSFLGFFKELQVLLHLLLVRECNASDSLQRVIGLVTEEIC